MFYDNSSTMQLRVFDSIQWIYFFYLFVFLYFPNGPLQFNTHQTHLTEILRKLVCSYHISESPNSFEISETKNDSKITTLYTKISKRLGYLNGCLRWISEE